MLEGFWGPILNFYWHFFIPFFLDLCLDRFFLIFCWFWTPRNLEIRAPACTGAHFLQNWRFSPYSQIWFKNDGLEGQKSRQNRWKFDKKRYLKTCPFFTSFVLQILMDFASQVEVQKRDFFEGFFRDGPKRCPRGSQESPRVPKRAPRASKRAPRENLEGFWVSFLEVFEAFFGSWAA